MNLYKISQTENSNYDTYDSAIVAAESEEIARNIHPDGDSYWNNSCGSWCTTPDQVIIELIGKAIKNTKRGIILTSFNAG